MGFSSSDADFLSSFEACNHGGDALGPEGSSVPLPAPEELDDVFAQLDITDGTLALPRLSMEPCETGFGAHYDEVFELNSEDEDDCALDVEEYRRIAIECKLLSQRHIHRIKAANPRSLSCFVSGANSFHRSHGTANDSEFDPAHGDEEGDNDDNKAGEDGMERHDRGSDRPTSLVGEATHWRGEAEKYFHECTRLRSMVRADIIGHARINI